MNEGDLNEGPGGAGAVHGTRFACELGGRMFTLIGTAHVSRESVEEVRAALRDEADGGPDMVCVELDEGRYNALRNRNAWEKLDVVKVLREGKGFLLAANLVLAGFQRRLGKELGVKPGEEMKAAVECAAERGIPWALCDREVQVTLQRAWAGCGLWSKAKLAASLISSAFITEKLGEEEVENLKKSNELDGMMNELAHYLPQVKRVLIDERDRYLAAKIWAAGGTRTLAVVGAGHLPGIKAHLERLAAGEETAEVAELAVIPPPSPAAKALPWLLPAALVALFGYGVYRLGAGPGWAMVRTWLLWNGSLAAAGALLALGHPLSVLVSFLTAPVATINPIIGVGLFSGLTQAALRKPRVEDAASINDDITSIRGIYRNRITRALLVFFLSTLGSAAGNIVSFSSIAGQFFK